VGIVVDMDKTYEELRDQVRALAEAGRLPRVPSDEQRADFAYGNAKLSNDAVTRAMAVRAAGVRHG
jgi:hypothetical protein